MSDRPTLGEALTDLALILCCPWLLVLLMLLGGYKADV